MLLAAFPFDTQGEAGPVETMEQMTYAIWAKQVGRLRGDTVGEGGWWGEQGFLFVTEGGLGAHHVIMEGA